MSKLTVALLSGGRSAEREVSLKSGDQVYQALDKEKYHVRRYDPRDDLGKLMDEAAELDVAVIILHGRYGEDGTIQGLLELLDIPYHGSGVLGSALGINKIQSKKLYEQAGLPVSPYLVLDHADPDAQANIEETLGFPVVVKPEHEGSSIGLSIVGEASQLLPALELAGEYDRLVLVEKFIAGTEITGAVLGNLNPEPLPLVEILPGDQYDFFTYEAKYKPGATEEICPARLSQELTGKAQDYAVRAHQALRCRGYSRTDMIVGDDEIYVLETNTIPGMTATSLYPQAAAAAGMSFSELLDRLIELALEKD
ncbi:MAG: D-alanine--D-alanine ligase [Deltaproteobacteria bacterium]|nr:MAG: D-alanine--D-alanine ligase [Deltaproteobacteria bacterium]